MISRLLILLSLLVISCGRPHSTDQEKEEAKRRGRLGALSSQYNDVEGSFAGSLELLDDGTVYKVYMDLRVSQDVDPGTGLPLQPKIVGSLRIFEMNSGVVELLTNYGITNGSYDSGPGKIAIDISDALNIRGYANHNVLRATLHSSIKGDIGKLDLVRQ